MSLVSLARGSLQPGAGARAGLQPSDQDRNRTLDEPKKPLVQRPKLKKMP